MISAHGIWTPVALGMAVIWGTARSYALPGRLANGESAQFAWARRAGFALRRRRKRGFAAARPRASRSPPSFDLFLQAAESMRTSTWSARKTSRRGFAFSTWL